jgi:AraC-like DNA-binding protein
MAKFETERAQFTSYGLSCVRWNPSPMPSPDHHNEIQLNLLRRGRVTYMIGGVKTKVPVGQFLAFWAAMPHQIIDYEEDTEYFVATIPLAWFLQCQLPDQVVQPLMRGEVVTEPRLERTAMDAALFVQWEQDLKKNHRVLREIVTREMETRLRRLGLALEAEQLGPAGRPPAKVQMGGLNKVEQMVCYIARSYLEPVTVDDIGKAVGMHPNSAMRLFKKVFGTTLIDHITHHRVFHAKRLLATTDQKIVDVAYSSGFSSISRFNEAFRRASGCTPRTYRAEHAGGD